MEYVSYNVGKLRKIIAESAQEFEPKIGAGVRADNERNNEKSYKNAEKAAKDFDGGLKPEKKGELPAKEDYNKTTLDYNPRTEVSKEQKDNWEAQAKGYTSKLEEDNGIEKGGAEFDNDGKIYNQIKDANEKMNKEREELAKAGIRGNKKSDDLEGVKTENTMVKENKKPVAKRLNFNHTRFLNEAQMLSRIPEEYKKDGQVIYMNDKVGNEYVVECVLSESTGFIETNVVSYKNEKAMNEQLERINQLFDYKTPATCGPTSMETRVNESKGFEDLMNLSRGLVK